MYSLLGHFIYLISSNPCPYQISMTEIVMVPDADKRDFAHINESRDPRKIPAADQMCFIGDKNPQPALYNYDQCITGLVQPQPNPRDPNSEVEPNSQKAGVDLANNTVKISCKKFFQT